MHWKDILLHQLEENADKNIFSGRLNNNFNFSPELKQWLLSRELLHWDPVKTENRISELVNMVLESFYQVNQYYQFDQAARNNLKLIYFQLFREFKILLKKDDSIIDSETNLLMENHFLRLQKWLKNHQPFAEQLNPPDVPQAIKVVCAEYQVNTQLQALAINPLELKYPLLDLGCGKEAHLVNYLKQYNSEVYGLDRITPPQDHFFQSDWLEFDFVPESWATIVSHLGFSNHFLHHHHRLDGNYLAYARKYMEILQSLIPGGTFVYTPNLDFIETWIDLTQFKLEKGKVPEVGHLWTRINKL